MLTGDATSSATRRSAPVAVAVLRRLAGLATTRLGTTLTSATLAAGSFAACPPVPWPPVPCPPVPWPPVPWPPGLPSLPPWPFPEPGVEIGGPTGGRGGVVTGAPQPVASRPAALSPAWRVRARESMRADRRGCPPACWGSCRPGCPPAFRSAGYTPTGRRRLARCRGPPRRSAARSRSPPVRPRRRGCRRRTRAEVPSASAPAGVAPRSPAAACWIADANAPVAASAPFVPSGCEPLSGSPPFARRRPRCRRNRA